MPTPSGDVAHLLRRAGIGGTAAEVQALAPLDIRAIVDRVVETTPPAVTMPALIGASDRNYEQWVAMTHWWFDRMVSTPAPLAEKMTLFWHGHLCSAIEKVESARSMWDQHVLLRTKGMGSVRDLVQAISIDPAMLRYLDNDQNVLGSPNENFARELMELFTLGVNEYTQDDIVAAARAWTGYGLNYQTRQFVYRANRHDFGMKTFFGQTKAWDGPAIVDEILLGKKKDVAARFIVTKLWTFFAYENPESTVVDALVRVYKDNDLQMKPVVKALFLRPEFYSTKAKRGLVRSPIEYMAAVMKGTGLPASVVHPEWFCRGMGQIPFSPPNVSGWRPNGYWISASAQWAKVSFANYVRWKSQDAKLLDGVLRGLAPADSVKTVLRQFGIDNAGPQTKAALQRYVERERATDRWAELPNLLFLVMMSPEMQLA
jgi:uncharacterized protein (DUF1800 family)